MKQKDTYISLKEASQISGYAPDYIGQLIRSGKLPGKQVYTNIAWMTTEEAIREYMERRQSGSDAVSAREKILTLFKNEKKLRGLFKIVVFIALMVLLALAVLLFYIFSASLEERLNDKAVQQIGTDL